MPGLVVTHMGDSFTFDGGTLCLQFLAAPQDLIGWASAALGVEAVAMMTLQEARDADTLTGVVRRVATALAKGKAPAIGDIARVNRLANAPDLAPQVGPGGAPGWPADVSHGQVIATVARDAVRLLTSDQVQRVRLCAAEDCDLIFLDTSRPGQRRWCAMSRCGNRAKVRAYRARA